MKKVILKSALYSFLLPLAGSIFFLALSCFFSRMYYDWYWVKEWLIYLPDLASYYLMLFSVFAACGVIAYFVLYQKLSHGLLLSGAYLVGLVIFPALRYLTRHLVFLGAVDAETMLTYFLETIDNGLGNLLYLAIFLVIIYAEKLFFAKVLKEKPEWNGRAMSPKHPVGMAMLIYFSALFLISLITFFADDDYSAGSFIMMGLEVLIDTAGFFVATSFAALTEGALRDRALEVPFVDLEALLRLPVSEENPIELVASAKEDGVTYPFRLGKRLDQDTGKEIWWLAPEGAGRSFEFSSFEQLRSATVVAGKNLRRIWKNARVSAINGEEPRQKMLEYLCPGVPAVKGE